MPGSTLAAGNIQYNVLLKFTNSFASVAANTTAQQTVTVPGLRPTDQISAVSKTTFQAGLIVYSADISANDTLRVTFGNFTIGAIVPLAGDSYTIEVNRAENPTVLPAALV